MEFKDIRILTKINRLSEVINMAKIIYKDGTVKIVSRKQLSFILGIKNIKSKVFTYEFI